MSVLSLRVVSGTGCGPARATSCDRAALKAGLAAAWGRFCLQAFPSDEACAAFFGVSARAAAYWRSGEVCRPSSHHLMLALLAFPHLAAQIAADCGVGARRAA